jgi:hypothetical protein
LGDGESPRQTGGRFHGVPLGTGFLDVKRGTAVPGIFSLESNELKVCLGREGDQAPPASFDINKAEPGMSPTCMTFRREKK